MTAEPDAPPALAELRDFLRTQRNVASCELEARFAADPAGLKDMLDAWEKHGTIRRYQGGCGGGWCEACETGCSERIVWNGD